MSKAVFNYSNKGGGGILKDDRDYIHNIVCVIASKVYAYVQCHEIDIIMKRLPHP